MLRIMADTLPHIVKLYKDDPKQLEQINTSHFQDAIFCRLVMRELHKFNISYKNEEPLKKSDYLDYFIAIADGMQAYGWLKNPQRRFSKENVGQTWFSIDEIEAKKPLKQAFIDAKSETEQVEKSIQTMIKMSEDKIGEELDKMIKNCQTEAIKAIMQKALKEVSRKKALEELVKTDGLLDHFKTCFTAGCDVDKSLREIFQVDGIHARSKRHCGLLVRSQGKYGFIHESFYGYFLGLDTIVERQTEILERLENDAYEYSNLFRGTTTY